MIKSKKFLKAACNIHRLAKASGLQLCLESDSVTHDSKIIHEHLRQSGVDSATANRYKPLLMDLDTKRWLAMHVLEGMALRWARRWVPEPGRLNQS